MKGKAYRVLEDRSRRFVDRIGAVDRSSLDLAAGEDSRSRRLRCRKVLTSFVVVLGRWCRCRRCC